jgi:hypothetical protein
VRTRACVIGVDGLLSNPATGMLLPNGIVGVWKCFAKRIAVWIFMKDRLLALVLINIFIKKINLFFTT